MSEILNVKNLTVLVEDKTILNKLTLSLEKGKTHTLMGRNGSGKSTLAQVIMGSPVFRIGGGSIYFEGVNITDIPVEKRSGLGIFLSFQYPSEVAGVSIGSFLRMIYNKSHNENISPVKFRQLLADKLELLKIKEEFLQRYLNEGFSGGEKKKMEMLQMLLLEPKLVMLDEVDSGLDVDAVKNVASAVNYLKENNNSTVLIITHYARILKFIKPDFVHVMGNGEIIKTGGRELSEFIEEHGYSKLN